MNSADRELRAQDVRRANRQHHALHKRVKVLEEGISDLCRQIEKGNTVTKEMLQNVVFDAKGEWWKHIEQE